jgi:outer membrane protein assembly factor BamA
MVESASAQDKPLPSPQVKAKSLENSSPLDVGMSAPNTKSEEESSEAEEKTDNKDKEKPRSGSILIAPLPLVSPAIGSGIIPIVGYIFPFSKNDKMSPPSTVGAAGLITNNGTRGFGLGAQLFLKQDTYEVTAGYARGNFDYSLYGIGIAAGNAGLKLPLEQTGQVFLGEVLRRVVWKVFVGPRFVDGNSLLTLRPSSGNAPPIPSDLGIHTSVRAVGIHVVRDTRPDHFYPTTGTKLEFTADFFSQALGSKYSFQRYKSTFDKFVSLSKSQVLAYDLYLCDTGGAAPFYANCIYGTSNELRGYTAGRYLDRHMFATQLEYRLSLPKRLGLAGFAGVGEVVPGETQVLRSNNLLPSAGGGPRFVMSPKYHVNLRADFARGKNSWTWSMGVGEAF